MKIHKVTIYGMPHYVLASTKAGAKRDVIRSLRAAAEVELATPDEIYAAGQRGVAILNRPAAEPVGDDQQNLNLNGQE